MAKPSYSFPVLITYILRKYPIGNSCFNKPVIALIFICAEESFLKHNKREFQYDQKTDPTLKSIVIIPRK